MTTRRMEVSHERNHHLLREVFVRLRTNALGHQLPQGRSAFYESIRAVRVLCAHPKEFTASWQTKSSQRN